MVRTRLHTIRTVLLIAGLFAPCANVVGGQGLEPIVYTIRVPAPESQIAEIDMAVPTAGRADIELMMPIWSPGYYRVQDYAGQIQEIFARSPDGESLRVEQTRANRWRVQTGGMEHVVVTYRLLCQEHFVTTNWVSPELGVFNGSSTYLTLVESGRRPREVRIEPPPTWARVATGLAEAPGGEANRFWADDYDTLVDAPIVAGDLEVHAFQVGGVEHLLVDVGEREGWDGEAVARDLQGIVNQSLPLWGELPYEQYVFLNAFRRGGGGLEHANSTLLTTSARRVATPEGYRSWLSFAAHEYIHAFNVKRLRPVELGPFDYENPPRTASLWLAEGGTSYLGDLLVTRAGLWTAEQYLASLSAQIARLQRSPGRLLQSLEESSLEVWENSNSGVSPDSTTVSYYVKGEIVAFLLDAKIRRATEGRRTFEDVMRLAYRRYGGERGFTPGEFRATTEEVAGTDLGEWFRRAISSTEELDYSEALEWYGLRFGEGGWQMEVREDATEAQRTHLRALLAPAGQGGAAGQEAQGRSRRGETDRSPTLGLEQGFVELEAPGMTLRLVQASQTVAGLLPDGADGFDFTPGDWVERRAGDGFYHLGDLTLRLRVGEGGSGRTGAGDDEAVAGAAGSAPGAESGGQNPWREYSTTAARQPVEPLEASSPVLAAADLGPTLPGDIPLRVRRYWEVDDGHLALRFELSNTTDHPVEIGAVGIPMVFNNILSGRSLDEAHAVSSFQDPYIGRDAGYLQVTRLSGHGPALVVVPQGRTPFEAYNPLLTDPTRRSVTFEGFYEWMAHSRAHAEEEWSEAEAWNPPTSVTLEPGESRSYGVRFLVADSIRGIESTLLENGRAVAVGVPGYVLPMDLEARLFLKHQAAVESIRVEPAGALSIETAETTQHGWRAYDVRGREWGRARVTVTYGDGTEQAIHYMVIKPAIQVIHDLGRFLTTEQWFEDPGDPFGRSPSVISYDYDEGQHVTEDNRAWIAGLGDEGGSGSWLAAIMKQLVQPDPAELEKMQRFVDGVVWGGLQYADGELMYGVRKSLFYYQPDEMPEGTYSESVRYGGWSSWDKEHAMTVGRSYDYPHVAALHWVLYRLARNHEGLVTNHPWEWYLERAYQTGEAMVRHAAHYAQFGQMEGTVFLLILLDLQREGWAAQADALEATMRARAKVWRSLGYPFGSEMPWDSTGQEEVYAWCRYFGFDDKALVTLNAILGYMPTVPHWGYNGSARRYWDFQYAGKLRRVERQLHHYGSGLNAIPVLSEFRSTPHDLYLLRVGYGGLMGAIANITREGFGPSGFHAYPSTLRIDGYSGDYGPGFLGHVVNTGTYLAHDPELGWVAFGGNLTEAGDVIRVRPLDSARSRVYLAPLGLWLTLDAGAFESVEISSEGVRVALAPATAHAAIARLRIERPAVGTGAGPLNLPGGVTPSPAEAYAMERGAYLISLRDEVTEVVLIGRSAQDLAGLVGEGVHHHEPEDLLPVL